MKNKAVAFLVMHLGFLLYSSYTIVGKIAAQKDFLSFHFILLYGAVVFILVVYAFLWQKVLKVFPLSVATANKAVTILWGILFGRLLFGESVKPTMIAGAVIILAGILFLNSLDAALDTTTEENS
ncbi:MAG: EamA family transporter [Treponema sp.]|nr:EamA family transporter [Treponema sp.]